MAAVELRVARGKLKSRTKTFLGIFLCGGVDGVASESRGVGDVFRERVCVCVCVCVCCFLYICDAGYDRLCVRVRQRRFVRHLVRM